jgi:tetratricopeptide (TPR) repeat protein
MLVFDYRAYKLAANLRINGVVSAERKLVSCLALSLVFLFHPATIESASAQLIKLPQWKLTEQEAMSLTGTAQEKKLQEALEQAKEKNQADGYPQSECLFNLGIHFTELNKPAEAESYFAQAVDLKQSGLKKVMSTGGYVPGILPAYSNPEQEHDGKVHDLANCLSWLGRTYVIEKNYDQAAKAFNQAIMLLDTSKDPNHEAIVLPDTLLRAARVERLRNHLSEAKKMEERASYILKNRQILDR